MYEFTAEDQFEIKGRGPVFTIGGEQIPDDLDTPYFLRNTNVKIDGHVYHVMGVEMFMVGGCETYYKRGFGLLVREPREDEL